jgi:signal transduction histidine kinase
VLLAQASAIEQQIEYQLARARAAAGRKPAGRGVAIPEVARPILRAMERLHPDKRFTLEATGCAGKVLPLDPVDFAEVLSILLDNAGKWGRAEVRLSFTAMPDGGCLVTVADDGPGIPEELIEQAFQVGTRFDPGTPGSGLGLAIARELCEAMGLELTLRNGSRGLVASLRHAA